MKLLLIILTIHMNLARDYTTPNPASTILPGCTLIQKMCQKILNTAYGVKYGPSVYVRLGQKGSDGKRTSNTVMFSCSEIEGGSGGGIA